MALSAEQLLGSLLRDVSRSFYLTLRILPARVRTQIGLAYLLARATDTVADTKLLPVEKRLESLAALRSRIFGRTQERLNFGAIAEHQGTPGERVLLGNIEGALALLSHLSANDRALVNAVLDTITSGQELDLKWFGGASESCVQALQTSAELDDYTYRVAGCVGEFWTRICLAHLFDTSAIDTERLLTDGVRFGKGLQMVNILRDLPRDVREGRCYIPEDRLNEAGLKPQQLLRPDSEQRFRPIYNNLLDVAQGHLEAGWRYTNLLPPRAVRVKLACAWPVLIGRETLGLLRTHPVLDPKERVKVSRKQVRAILLQTCLRIPFASSFSRLWPGAVRV